MANVTTVRTARCVTAWSVSKDSHQMASQDTSRDFWVAYDGVHTEPTYMKDEGDGQGWLRQIAYRYVKQWRGCIDAGANVGMWTRFMMRDFDQVHCFEPNPVFVDCWKRNIPLGKNATLHEVGLGETENTAKYGRPLGQKLVKEPGDVKIKTLDSFELTDIDFIKIDVDGYEDLLLLGAKETLANNNPVINIEMKKHKRPKLYIRTQKILRECGYVKQKRTRSEEVWLKP